MADKMVIHQKTDGLLHYHFHHKLDLTNFLFFFIHYMQKFTKY